jgi:hypothetical protein
MLPQLIMSQIQKLTDILFKQEGTEKAKKPSHAIVPVRENQK